MVTIVTYINKKRIYNSLISLKETNDSILKIGLNHGYTSLEYFSETFNNIIGVSPKKCRDFYNRKPINIEDIEKIRSSIAKLNFTIHKIDSYKLNIKKEETKILSIFKQKSSV